MKRQAPAQSDYRFALNPIQWFATPDGWLDPTLGPPPEKLLELVKSAGFDAIHAQIPPGWTAKQYAQALDQTGLTAAPGYFPVGFEDHGISADDAVEGAKRLAADLAALGLTDMFLGPKMSAERLAQPGLGAAVAGPSFEEVIGLFDRISAATKAEGVLGAYHSHIGSRGETEPETRQLLEAIPAGQLGFGPDTGHLAWADADIPALFRDYADRIRMLHVKNINLDVRNAARANGKGYKATVVDGLWTEPSKGTLDLAAIIQGLGADFDGWLIAEVDFPSMDPFESATQSAAWLHALKAPGAALSDSDR